MQKSEITQSGDNPDYPRKAIIWRYGVDPVPEWLSDRAKIKCIDNNGNPQFGWISERNNWYHFNADGAMQTGWSSIDGNWYYFNGQGEMATEWKQINGKWYYFDNSGKMLSNTVIDGCTLGSDGKMI